MTLERWRENPLNAQALEKVLKSEPMATVIQLLKDRAMPSSLDVKAPSAADRMILAAAEHDVQAGWHDCIRFLLSMAMPQKIATQNELPQQYDEEYVRKVRKQLGRPLPEPQDKITKTKIK